ncbi:MAG: glycosyltransferase family 4 protein [Flavobacteriales bacterium]|nr:glycosyltransferase family 4 protein [Flavobacteriales bacterium]
MIIGFDAKRAFHNASGLGNYSRFVVRILAQHHPEHQYVLFNPKSSNLWSPPEGEHISEVNPKNGILASYWRTFGGASKAKKHGLDIYHGLSNELPYGIKKSAVGKVVTIHDLIFLRLPDLYKPADRIIYTKKFKHAAQTADKIVAISETTKADIIDYLDVEADKIEVVYQGCDPIFNTKVDRSFQNSVLKKYKLPEQFMVCVGTIEKRKNALQILQAMEAMKVNCPLIVIGKSTKYVGELMNYIHNNPDLKSKIYFLHNINNQELKAVYQMATLSVYPSVFEGFGIPVLESIACGTPVVTTQDGCFVEAGGDGALYVDSNNIEELGGAIKSVIDSSEIQSRLKESGAKHLLQFKETKLATDLMNVYKSIK